MRSAITSVVGSLKTTRGASLVLIIRSSGLTESQETGEADKAKGERRDQKRRRLQLGTEARNKLLKDTSPLACVSCMMHPVPPTGFPSELVSQE